MPGQAQKREQTPDLYQSAVEVAFGHDGAQMAAEAAAAGSVADADDLTDRDKQMLAVGTMIGAAAAIARSRYPYEHTGNTLERADLVGEHGRRVCALDRERRPIFGEVSKEAEEVDGR